MKEENNFEVPFQVQTLIISLCNKKEHAHIRSNYRMRLDSIRNIIDSAINEYDNEMGAANVFNKRRKSNGRR